MKPIGKDLWPKLYYPIIIIFFLFGITSSVYMGASFDIVINFESYGLLILAALLYLVSHLIRIFRLYILFIEKRFSFFELFKIYTLTTWMNFVIPFRIGELFRITEYAKLCKNFKMGFIAIWIERLFDSFILVFIIMFLAIRNDWNISNIFVMLAAFIMISLFLFLSFPASFRYTNQLIISESKTRKGLYVLEILDSLREYYQYSKKLLRGRYAILIIVSSVIWLLELVVFSLSLSSSGIPVAINNINTLINGLWTPSVREFGSAYNFILYIVLSLAGFLVILNMIVAESKKLMKTYARNKNLYGNEILPE